VLAGTYAGWRGSLPEEAWRDRLAKCLALAAGPSDQLVSGLLPGMFSNRVSARVREDFAAMVSETRAAGFRLMTLSSAETDTRSLLPQIRIPTLLLWGAEDQRSSLQIAQQFEAALPNATLVVLPGAGHVSNLEQPDAFNRHVRRFLQFGLISG
jgi:pimeloyl-ACP methyl ester carboxylesterase